MVLVNQVQLSGMPNYTGIELSKVHCIRKKTNQPGNTWFRVDWFKSSVRQIMPFFSCQLHSQSIFFFSQVCYGLVWLTRHNIFKTYFQDCDTIIWNWKRWICDRLRPKDQSEITLEDNTPCTHKTTFKALNVSDTKATYLSPASSG